jgi:hypothetical protein
MILCVDDKAHHEHLSIVTAAFKATSNHKAVNKGPLCLLTRKICADHGLLLVGKDFDVLPQQFVVGSLTVLPLGARGRCVILDCLLWMSAKR